MNAITTKPISLLQHEDSTSNYHHQQNRVLASKVISNSKSSFADNKKLFGKTGGNIRSGGGQTEHKKQQISGVEVTTIRVHILELKAEIEIDCQLHDTFWNLKLCLVDSLLSSRDGATTDGKQTQSTSLLSSKSRRRPNSIVSQLLSSRSSSSSSASIGGGGHRSSLASRAKNAISRRRGQQQVSMTSSTTPPSRCYSSGGSLSSTDASTSSSFLLTGGGGAFTTSSQLAPPALPPPRLSSGGAGDNLSLRSGSALYYGFSALNLSPWDDNARHSNDLTEEEEAAVSALDMATAANDNSVEVEYDLEEGVEVDEDYEDDDDEGDYATLALNSANDRRISTLMLHNATSGSHRLTRTNSGNHYYHCTDSNNNNTDDDNDDDYDNDYYHNDHLNKLRQHGNRMFEKALHSGYLNYGFYSFSLAKYVDDQTYLTDYLSLVSSSSGTSYYLDLEFKLKQRQQAPLLANAYLAPPPLVSSNNNSNSSTNNITLNVINRQSQPPPLVAAAVATSSQWLAKSSSSTNLRFGPLSQFAASLSQQKVTKPKQENKSSNHHNNQQQQNFANNMIAKLSTGGGGSGSGGAQSHQVVAVTTSMQQQQQSGSAQSKRKRSKLIDILLNTNWSKQSQQASNLVKLNKILLVCDANFLEEKSGESPISLAISSPQINAPSTSSQSNNQHHQTSSSSLAATNCPQSTSLFNLQCQSTSAGMSQLMLQQTNITELSRSRAPLVERLLLLLVKSGALIDFRNSDGRTPLHVAAMKSNFWALKTLLDLGASTDYRDINGLTPLYYSILHKANLKVTQLLLSHNRNPSNGAAIGNGSSSSHVAAAAGAAQPDSIASLSTTSRQHHYFQQSTGIGITDQHGWQEVHQACKLGLDAHLEKLLYYGCDMNAKISGSGNTPLHVAAINDQLNCAKVLLMRGANKTITNNSHQTAHQVAVISNNMDLAEFIAEHDESKVVPFRERPANFTDMSSTTSGNRTHIIAQSSARSSTRSSLLANSQSSASIFAVADQQQQQRAIVHPQLQQHQQYHHHMNHMNPLVLDVAQGANNGSAASSSNGAFSSTSTTSTSGQPQSLLSISGSNVSGQTNQLNVQVNNISPCLSQRSCATSNTTSSSGVCCDGDGNNSAEEQQHHQQAINNHLVSSQSQHSNITIISINNKADMRGAVASDRDHHQQQHNPDEMDEEEDGGDLRSSGSSSNDLYSLMSEERPLFAGTLVEATSEYQSGDPNHLQLRRGDLIEVLEYTPDLLQAGQLPRLANKPMLFGRRQSDGLSGLFPSFCVHRTKQTRQSIMRQKMAMTDITNSIAHPPPPPPLESTMDIDQNSFRQQRQQQVGQTNIQPTMATNAQTMRQDADKNLLKLRYKEISVTLNKINEGFGFVLRGAKVDPAILAQQTNKAVIDERLMAANNLVGLQYLDEIEVGSVAHQAGLKRGDFLVAVNQQDVRLSSHEQVVHMIRQSGDQVHLTIATPILEKFVAVAPNNSSQQQQHPQTTTTYSSKTVGKVKPEPPKRDPTTTLTRNRAQRVKSMFIAPPVAPAAQVQQQQKQQSSSDLFDASKPLPLAPSTSESPMSPTGSLNMMGRSISTNLAHFHSAQSLSSSTADTQSISSVSTISADQQNLQQTTPTHSSSSTTTLTTVAAIVKPKAPPKPNGSTNPAAQIQVSANIQPVYQPAVITTTKRVSQPNLSPQSPPKVVPSSQVSPAPATVQPAQPQLQSSHNLLSPPPPPPPPPLPDFSATPPTASQLSKRRTSAPINQLSSGVGIGALVIDSKQLQRKRESLANISHLTNNLSSNAPVPAQFGAVAAACAAAANNRLQRQQQLQLQQQQQQQQQQDQQPPQQKSQQQQSTPEQHKQHQPQPAEEQIEQQAAETAPGPVIKASEAVPFVENVKQQQAGEPAIEQAQTREESPNARDVEQLQTTKQSDQSKLVEEEQQPSSQVGIMKQVNRQHLSATLGRKSSAQIIQQPKQQPLNYSQSQTLRAKPKRPSIPNYDELPPPPPPLPMMDEPNMRGILSELRQSTMMSVYQQQQLQQQHLHQHRHHNHQHVEQHQQMYQPEMVVATNGASKRLSQEYSIQQQQQQQLLLQKNPQLTLHQQQMIQQQLRQQHLLQHQQQQQHLLQQQQQQLKLQQQLQLQQRQLCLSGKHSHAHGHDHNRRHTTTIARTNQHLHEQHHQQQLAAAKTHSHHSRHQHHHNHHSHHPHSHHHHNHEPTSVAMQQQQQQQLQQQQYHHPYSLCGYDNIVSHK